jgi:hypothetical protein
MLTEPRRFICVSYGTFVVYHELVAREDWPYDPNILRFSPNYIPNLATWVWYFGEPTTRYLYELEEVTFTEVVAARLRGEPVHLNPNAMEI